jgi:hypothetical protein
MLTTVTMKKNLVTLYRMEALREPDDNEKEFLKSIAGQEVDVVIDSCGDGYIIGDEEFWLPQILWEGNHD